MQRKIKNVEKTQYIENHKINAGFMDLYTEKFSEGRSVYHYKPVKSVIEFISSKEASKNQSYILERSLEHPDKNIILDCDKIMINIKISCNDFESFKNNIGKVKTKEKRSFLKVKIRKPLQSERLIGCYKSLLVVSISAITNEFNKVNVYLYKINDNKYGLHLVFTPRLFHDTELNVIFHHLQSVFGCNRYNQVISRARVSRVDIGLNLKGISKSCLVTIPKYSRCKVSNYYPNSDKQGYLESEHSVTESYYHGSQKGSHLIVYDSSLNNLNRKKQSIGLVARVEYRYLLHASKMELTVSTLPYLKPTLHLYRFINPWIFKCLPATLIKELITNQGIASQSRAWSEVKSLLKQRGKTITSRKRKRKGLISLDDEWLLSEQINLLTRYKLLLLKPKSSSSMIKTYISST